MKINFVLALILALLVTFSAPAKVIFIPDIEVLTQVVYAETPQEKLKLDVVRPLAVRPCPVVVFFHSGNFDNGDKLSLRAKARTMAQSGYVVFIPDYRLARDAIFPAAVNDAMGAVIWAKEHAAEYNGDPNRVVVMGNSAGAYLSAIVALAWDDPYFTPSYLGNGRTTAEPLAAVLVYGAYRLDWVASQDPKSWNSLITPETVQNFMGGSPEDRPEHYQKASLQYYLDRGNIPPILICSGTDESTHAEAVWLDDELKTRAAVHTFYSCSAGKKLFLSKTIKRQDLYHLRLALDFLDKKTGNCGPLIGGCKKS
jgi:acetyl esterase/lipase